MLTLLNLIVLPFNLISMWFGRHLVFERWYVCNHCGALIPSARAALWHMEALHPDENAGGCCQPPGRPG